MLAALAVALFAIFQPASAANAVTISLNDSDNVVAAGAGYEVHVRVMDGATNNSTDFVLEYIVVEGGVVLTGETAGEALEQGVTTAEAEATLVVPAGAKGVYTITAGVLDDNGGAGGGPLRLIGTLDVTVGDVGAPIGSVEVSLGTVYDADDNGAPNFLIATSSAANREDSATDSDTKPAEGIIGVTVTVLNSLGNAPNGSEISELLIFAPSAFVDEADGETEAASGTITAQENANSAEGTTSPTATSFNFWVTDADEGTIDVYAVAIGSKGGTATSDKLTLAFTGSADVIEVSDANTPIGQKEGTGHVSVTATDKSGNAANLNAASANDNVKAKLVDSDGDAVPSTRAKAVVKQAPKANVDFFDGTRENDTATTDVDESEDETYCNGDNVDAECDSKKIRVTVTTTALGLAPGVYTLEVTLGDNEAVTSSIIISGDPENIEVEASSSTVAVGDIVTFTATVTDEDGNVIPDGTSVVFNAVGAVTLTGLGGGADKGIVTSALNDGVASARYVVVTGSGAATIIATHGEGATALDGVTSVSTMAEEPEAMPEEEASVGCLSNLAGFATWACGVESSASEIFGLVNGRGATALHLWNGSAWVRYSVVDGTMVPGSSDFMVAENDILYISN